MASLPTPFQTCEPRPEVLSGDLPDAIFAADLWQVYEGKGHPDYRNAQRFLSNNYPTESMRFLLSEVSRTLARRPGGTPVFRLETGFGGAKTHGLIEALHIAPKGGDSQELGSRRRASFCMVAAGRDAIERLQQPQHLWNEEAGLAPAV